MILYFLILTVDPFNAFFFLNSITFTNASCFIHDDQVRDQFRFVSNVSPCSNRQATITTLTAGLLAPSRDAKVTMQIILLPLMQQDISIISRKLIRTSREKLDLLGEIKYWMYPVDRLIISSGSPVDALKYTVEFLSRSWDYKRTRTWGDLVVNGVLLWFGCGWFLVQKQHSYTQFSRSQPRRSVVCVFISYGYEKGHSDHLICFFYLGNQI